MVKKSRDFHRETDDTTALTPVQDSAWEAFIQEAKPLDLPKKSFSVAPIPVFRQRDERINFENHVPVPADASMFHLSAGWKGVFSRKECLQIQKGTRRYDAMLDLHGMSLESAFIALTEFLQQAFQHKKRLLLIVTGKGKQGKGLIRQQFKQWVNSPEIRPFILGYETAPPHAGGDGAFYVMLRKSKDSA